jgi:type II secretory pathway pseudopilin PulG
MKNKIYKIRNSVYEIRNNHSGITLLELMVSVFLFAITMLMATQIFQTVISSQRAAMASQDLQDNIRYTFERMGKEVRSAQKDSSHSCIPSGNAYYIDGGGGLNFINYHGQCVRYFASSTQLYISYPNSGDSVLKNGLPLTNKEIRLNNLVFKIIDKTPSVQGMVSVRMNLSISSHGSPIEPVVIETTLSSRNYQ